MAESLYDQKESLGERWDKISQPMRLFILVSVFWPIFSVLYIWEPRVIFDFQAFFSRFILMGVLPLVIFWGTRWVVQGFKKDKHSSV